MNMFVSLGNGTIIAVGTNKTILRSTNNGQNWELVSYFKPIARSTPQVKFLGKDTILVLSETRPYYFISFDGGATFLPPKFEVENFPQGGSIVIFDDGTFGYLSYNNFTHIENINDSTTVLRFDSTLFYINCTTDLGESFSKKIFSRRHLFITDSTFFRVVKTSTINNNALVVFSWARSKAIDTTLDSYFYFFDKSFNVTDSVVQEKKSLI